MFGGLSAAGAGVSQILLFKGDAAGGHAGLLFHLLLTGQISAPHGLDETAMLFLKRLGFLHGRSGEDVAVQILLGLVEQALLDLLQHLRDHGLQFVQSDGDFLAVVTAYGHAHVRSRYLQ